MPTLGNTSKPTSTIEAWSGGTYEIVAQLLTMPSGGPWLITDVGVWAAGFGSNVTARVCLWSAAGTLISASPSFTLTGQPFANGNVSSWQRGISHALVNGGQQVFVGLQVAPNGGYQFGRYASGSHYDAKGSGLPSNFGSGGYHSPAASAWLVYESANQSPNAPTNLSPSGNSNNHQGTAPTVSGTRSDPDSGDYITAYQIIAYEDNGSTVIQDTGKINVGGTPTTFARTLALNGVNKFIRWKARTWDKGNLAGPYSAQQRFWANAVPSTPGAPTVENDNLTPLIEGQFSDPGDTMSAVQIEVTNGTSPFTSRWSSGDIAKSGGHGSAWSQTYAGSPLAWSVNYRARYRVKDSKGAYSSWSSWRSFTLIQPTGPDNMTPRTTSPRLASLTPTLTVGHSAQFINDEYQVMTGAGTGTTLLNKTFAGSNYSARTSQAYAYNGAALSHGTVYYWRSRVRLTDSTVTAWSGWMPFRINAMPSSPTGMTPTGGLTVPTLTPVLTASFADPDTDQGDHPTHVVQEVRNNATDALVESFSSGMAGQDPYSRTMPGGLLAWETTYKWRRRYTDAMGLQGPWSPYQVFKVSQVPSVALIAPPDDSAVEESTPLLDWSFSSNGGKAQKSYRVRIFNRGPVGAPVDDEVLVYDSGTVLSSATEFKVPFGVLDDDRQYRWTVLVTDTDNLSNELS